MSEQEYFPWASTSNADRKWCCSFC